MNALILDHIPISGKYKEISFDCLNDCVWVLFSDEDEISEWVGKLGIGFKSSYNKAMNLECGDLFFILSGGQGYLINASSEKLIGKTDRDDFEDCIYLSNETKIVLNDGLSIYFYDSSNLKLLWKSNRISWDGIKFTECKEGMIKGILNDLSPDGCEFEFSINDKKLKTAYNVRPPDSLR